MIRRDDIEARKADRRCEYEQLNEAWRHNETIGWSAGAIILPGCAAAFAAMWTLTATMARIGLASLSVALFAAWMLVHERLALITRARSKRAQEIERELGMEHHIRVAAAIAPPAREPGAWGCLRWILRGLGWLLSTPPHRFVWRAVFVALAFAAFGVAVLATPPQQSSRSPSSAPNAAAATQPG